MAGKSRIRMANAACKSTCFQLVCFRHHFRTIQIRLSPWMTGWLAPKSVVKKTQPNGVQLMQAIEKLFELQWTNRVCNLCHDSCQIFWGLLKNKHHLDLGVLYVHVHFDLFYLFFSDGRFPVFILMVFFSSTCFCVMLITGTQAFIA